MKRHGCLVLLLAACARFVAGSPVRAADPASANRVRNPGFEEGQPGALPVGWSDQKEGGAEGQVALTQQSPHGGRQCLAIEHTNDRGYIHPNHDVVVPPGVYAFAVWARSSTAGPFAMELHDARAWAKPRPATLQLGNGMVRQEFSLRPETWERCEMTVTVTEAFPASIQIGLTRRGTLWLDDVELRAVAGPPPPLLADVPGSHAGPLSATELAARTGWTAIRERTIAFSGDACLANRQVAVVLRRGAPAADYYAAIPERGFERVAELRIVGADGRPLPRLQSFSAYEVYPDKATLDVTAVGADGSAGTIRLSLRQDRRYVETEARAGAARLAIGAAAAFGVVPDLFGNDVVVHAARTPAAAVRFPSERVLLECLAGGDAMLVCVWPSPEQRVIASLSGEGTARVLSTTEISYRPELRGGVAVGVLAAPAIWHRAPIGDLKNVQGEKLPWTLPFDAAWRVDFRRREDGLIDSWVPTRKTAGGNWEFCRDNGSRTLWTSSRDDLVYPAYLDGGAMYLVNTIFADAMTHTRFQGARNLTFDPGDVALIYPFERSSATPADVHTVADLLQQALADTPDFETYRLMAPALLPRHRYPATCAVTARVEDFFDKGQELASRRAIVEDLRRMDYFVLTKRERIEEYMTWMRRTREWLAATPAGQSRPASVVARFEPFLARLDGVYHEGRGTYMKTPADCQALVEAVIALIDSTTDADKPAAVKALGKQIRSIGGAQDAVLGYMRQIVKELRQTAGLAMLEAQDDAGYELAREMRERTVELLRGWCSHEWK